MNLTYRTLFNESLGTWVAVPETATGKGKRSRGGKAKVVGVAVAAVLGLACPAYALDAGTLPTGGSVSAGSASIAASGNTLTVNQASSRLAIDWQSFNIGSAATVNFVQPNASAVALNRVLGSDPSQIYGRLNANGQVFLLNPNGILFGKGAEVNVGGLVASTLSLSNADFLSGNYRFAGIARSVINEGAISVVDKGYVALLGGQVSNRGAIAARLGNVSLAAGSDITLDFVGDGLIGVQVNQGTLNALAENKQLIQADGGTVLMTAKAADNLIQAVVNNEGVIEARAVDPSSGTIKLLADMDNGIVKVGGTLDASAPSDGKGGFIETSGHTVEIQSGAKVVGKSWLIDPTDITIDATAASTIAASLDFGTNVTETTSSAGSDLGNITVSSAIAWNGTGTLSLTAHNDIAINAAISGANGGLTLSAVNSISATAPVNVGTFTLSNGTWSQIAASLPAFSATDFRISGGTFIRALSGDGSGATPYRLADIYGVQGMGSSGMLANSYQLANDIDASGTSGWNSGAGFVPVGDATTYYSGVFDGMDHTISNLTINRPGTTFVGLFGISSGTIRNVNLTGVDVKGMEDVGGLVGLNSTGSITNGHVSGTITGSGDSVGGLAGYSKVGNIAGSDSSASVTGSGNYVGGLVGYNNQNTISNSHATGTVSGMGYHVGGLVGNNYAGAITTCYATGKVTGGGSNVGGLVGNNTNGSSISNSYATGTETVTGSGAVGGLVGFNEQSSSITNSYSTRTVSSVGNGGAAGGLVGSVITGSITNSYSTGTVSSNGTTGGLVGDNTNGNITNSYSTGTVSSNGLNGTAGGLVGYNAGSSHITNSYSTGTVSSNGLNGTAGGLVGFNNFASITNSYSTGTVSTGVNGTTGGLVGFHRVGGITNSYSTGSVSTGVDGTAGGLVGENLGSITNSYWDVTASGTSTGIGDGTTTGAAGKTADEMKEFATFSGWDISGAGGSTAVWRIYEGYSHPLLRSFLAPLTISAAGGNKGYDGTIDASSAMSYSLSSVDTSLLLGTLSAVTSSKDFGSYTVTPSGYFSSQQGYDISYATGTVSINKANATVTASSGSVTYNGNTQSISGFSATGLVAGETVSVLTGLTESGGSGQNAGSYTHSVSGSDGNYNLDFIDGALTIDKATLSLSGVTANDKIYDGTTAATITGTGILTGLVGNEDLTLNTDGVTAAFSDKNAGTGKTVTATGYSLGNGSTGLASNYTLTATSATATASINKADATVTASSASATYNGRTQSVSGFTATGLVAGETVSVLTGLSETGGAGRNAGSYAHSVSGSDGNYNLTFTDGSLSIGKAPLTVIANNATKTYDGLAYSGGNGVSYSGFVNGENSGVLGGFLIYGGSAQGAANAGSYTITPSGLTSGNYDIAFVNGALTIAVAPPPPVVSPSLVLQTDAYQAALVSADNPISMPLFDERIALVAAGTSQRTDSAGPLAHNGELFLRVIDGGLRLPEGLVSEPGLSFVSRE